MSNLDPAAEMFALENMEEGTVSVNNTPRAQLVQSDGFSREQTENGGGCLAPRRGAYDTAV